MRYLRYIACIMLLCSIGYGGVGIAAETSQEMVSHEQVDLNGDGKVDEISLSAVSETGTFTLTINDVSVRGRFATEEPADGFTMVDIDQSDPFREVAVHTPGPSDDDEYLIYGYDGTSIIEMGRLSRWPHFSGNGIVLVDTWMGFWKKREKYVLDRVSRKLLHVPQEFFYVGVTATVRKSFPIVRARGSRDVVAHLKPGSTILLLLYDPSGGNERYLIKSETGLLGWATYETIHAHVEALPLAD